MFLKLVAIFLIFNILFAAISGHFLISPGGTFRDLSDSGPI
jgi:hypothetical protein